MRRFSLSTLGHARICPGSAVLPGFDSVGGACGSAIHDGASVRVREGERAMLDMLPDICAYWNLSEVETAIVTARLRSWTPTIPDGALSEVPLGLFADGSVRVVRGGRGDYERENGLILAGTLDLLWSEPEPLDVTWCCGGDGCGCNGLPLAARCPPGSVLHAAEIKSGIEANVPRVIANWQLHGAALLAARWTGAIDGAPHTCFVAPGEGRWDDPDVALDGDDFDKIEAEIRRVATRVAEQECRQAAGEPLKLVTGPHCTHCRARAGCPAQLAEVRALVAPETTGSLAAGPLTPAQAKLLATQLGRAAAITDQARKVLQKHADTFGPIELDDGRVWGLHDTGKQRTHWDPIATFNALCDEDTVRREFAMGALSTSEKKIKDTIEAAHAASGLQRKVAPTKRAIYAAVAKDGGITKAPKLCYGPHHPSQTVRGLPASEENEGDNDEG